MYSKLLLCAALSIPLAGAPSFAVALQTADQPAQSSSSDSPTETHSGWLSPEETVARMSSKLNLTDDQKTKITPIIEDRQSQMRALMADTSSRRLQKARKAKSIMKDSDKKIEAVLTKDQKKTYEQMKEEMREQLRSRMQNRNNTPQL